MMVVNQSLADELGKTVQMNCHIADSQHAGDYTMCIYLLKMREYFRWEQGYHYTDKLPNKHLGAWLSERELLWDSLSEHDFNTISVNGVDIDPFDNDTANKLLVPEGLIYSGGLGRYCRPHFFLAELIEVRLHQHYTLYVSGKERARDLTALPAMTLGTTIFIRRESLKRMIWEKIEEWNWRKTNCAMSRAMSCFTLDADPDAALEQITGQEQETVLRHEIGEIEAGLLLDDNWRDMLASLTIPRAELMARALRDHLADCLSTLPWMIEQERYASLHYYFGQFNTMRREIFPGLMDAYQHWADSGELLALEQMIAHGREHWARTGRHICGLYQAHNPDASEQIANYLENNIL